jgi:hypothetical protein
MSSVRQVGARRRPLTVRRIVKENLASGAGDKALKLGGSRAVLALATGGWTHLGYVAVVLWNENEVSITSDENAFDNVRVAGEDGRSRIASVSVQIGDEEHVLFVVPNCRPTRKFGR